MLQDWKTYYAQEYYAHAQLSAGTFQHYRSHIKRLQPYLPPQPARILDYGCGYGYLIQALTMAYPQAQIVGFDIARASVEVTRQHSPQATLLSADGLWLPFIADSFDVACAFEVLEHFEDSSAGLAQMQRVLRPGGSIILMQQHRLDDYAHFVKQTGRWLRQVGLLRRPEKKAYSTREQHISAHTPAGWIALLEQQGFQVEQVLTLSVLPPLYYVIRPLRPHFFDMPLLSALDRHLGRSTWLAERFGLSFIYLGRKI